MDAWLPTLSNHLCNCGLTGDRGSGQYENVGRLSHCLLRRRQSIGFVTLADRLYGIRYWNQLTEIERRTLDLVNDVKRRQWNRLARARVDDKRVRWAGHEDVSLPADAKRAGLPDQAEQPRSNLRSRAHKVPKRPECLVALNRRRSL